MATLTLLQRINRALAAIPALQAAQEAQATPATIHKVFRKRTRHKRGLPPGVVQLALFNWQDGDQPHEQNQAG